MAENDELVSQWMAFTGSSDAARAASYLEMSGYDVETAVGLYMEHQGGGDTGGGGGGLGGGAAMGSGMGGGGDGDVRAPDATQTMRLMDDGPMGGPMGGMRGMHPYMQMDPLIEQQLQQSAFSSPSMFDARETVNSAAAAASANLEEGKDADMDDDDGDGVGKSDGDDDDDDEDKKPQSGNHLARLADMFAPPEKLIYKEGGFEGARNMAKDNKRWLLVNIQRDSEFASHALNRDVWRDELVENLVREGFIFWQAVSFHVGITMPRHADKFHS